MTRLASLDDNMLDTTLDGILTDIQQVKSRQIVGSSSLRPRIIQTTDPIDIFSDTIFGANYNLNAEIIFTADHQINPYARAFVELFTPNGAPLPFSVLSNFSSSEIIGADFQSIINQKQVSMVINMTSSPTVPFAIKIFLQASDSGTMEIINRDTA